MKKLMYYVAAAVLAVILTIIPLAGGGTPKTESHEYGLFGESVITSAESTAERLSKTADGGVYSFILGELAVIAPANNISVQVTESQYHYSYEDAVRYFGSSPFFSPRVIKNILVTVKTSKATADNDAILAVSHFDRAEGSAGAHGSALNIAVMLENIKLLASGAQQIKDANTIAFLFTSGYHEGDLGLRKFLDLKLNKINVADQSVDYSREKAVLKNLRLSVNLENFGTDGALMLLDTSAADYNLVRLYIEGGGEAVRAGSAVKEVFLAAYGGSSELLKDAGAHLLSFGAFGGAYKLNTPLDRYDENFNRDLLIASGVNLSRVLNTFGTINLATAATLGNMPNAVYFDYLGLKVNMSFLGVFMILALTLLFLAAALFLNFRRGEGRYNYYRILLAAAVNLLIIGAAFLETAVLKLILGIFGGTFGAVLSSPFYTSAILIIGFTLFGLASMTAWRFVYEKHLKGLFKNPDTLPSDGDFEVSAAMIFIFAALIFTVFLPSASYLFIFTALVCAIGLFVKNLVGNDFIKGLNLNLIGAVLALPLYITFARGLYLISGASALMDMIPLFGILFLFVLTAAAKYGARQQEVAAETVGEITASAPAAEAEHSADAESDSAAGGAEPAAPAPVKKTFRFTSLVAALAAAIIGFTFILSGGLDNSVSAEFGARLYARYQSGFDKLAYANAVNYVYEQNISRGENTGEVTAQFSGSRYAVAGEDIYNYLRKYTDIFGKASGGVRYASAPNLVPSVKPVFSLIEPVVTASDESAEPTEPETYLYRIDIKTAAEGNLFELLIPAAGALSAITVLAAGENLLQFNAPFSDVSVLYLNKSCCVDLYYTAPVDITVGYREIYLDALGSTYAAATPALAPLREIEGLRFNMLFSCKINLAPHYQNEEGLQ